jgi:hypothetical protein
MPITSTSVIGFISILGKLLGYESLVNEIAEFSLTLRRFRLSVMFQKIY